MALASLLCAALSLVCIAVALPTTAIPGVGAVFAFCAPALAFAGIVLGGVAYARGRKRSAPTGLAMLGVLTSLASLLPALLTAVTLGLLNLLFAHAPVQVQRSFHVQVQTRAGFADAGAGAAQSRPPPAAAPVHSKGSAALGTPPPALPPPPLAPGPSP
jgi:hypothetical protein